jgi:hypothetical protein
MRKAGLLQVGKGALISHHPIYHRSRRQADVEQRVSTVWSMSISEMSEAHPQAAPVAVHTGHPEGGPTELIPQLHRGAVQRQHLRFD